MKKVLGIIASLGIVLSGVFVSAPVFAADCSGGISDASCNKSCAGIDADPKLSDQDKKTLKEAAGCNTTSSDSVTSHILNMINIAITVVGIIAVLVIVMGGQRLITAQGDPGRVKQAKDMIMYAAIAVVVAALAFAIINFVSASIQSDANKGVGIVNNSLLRYLIDMV